MRQYARPTRGEQNRESRIPCARHSERVCVCDRLAVYRFDCVGDLRVDS